MSPSLPAAWSELGVWDLELLWTEVKPAAHCTAWDTPRCCPAPSEALSPDSKYCVNASEALARRRAPRISTDSTSSAASPGRVRPSIT